MIKRKKFTFILVLAIICLVISLSFAFSLVLSTINKQNNMKFDDDYDGIIPYQSPLKHIKMGVGNISDNGCGILSLYNILVLENKAEKLSTIVSKFEKTGLNIYGVWGTNPISLMNVLKSYSFKVNYYFDVKYFEEKSKASKYNILVYVSLFEQVGHYQLFYDYNEEENSFQCLVPKYKTSLENLMDETKNYFRFLITVN